MVLCSTFSPISFLFDARHVLVFADRVWGIWVEQFLWCRTVLYIAVFLASMILTHYDTEGSFSWLSKAPLVSPIMDLLLSSQPAPWNLTVLGWSCYLVCGGLGWLKCPEQCLACRTTWLLFSVETKPPEVCKREAVGLFSGGSTDLNAPLSWGQSFSSSGSSVHLSAPSSSSLTPNSVTSLMLPP